MLYTTQRLPSELQSRAAVGVAVGVAVVVLHARWHDPATTRSPEPKSRIATRSLGPTIEGASLFTRTDNRVIKLVDRTQVIRELRHHIIPPAEAGKYESRRFTGPVRPTCSLE